MEDRVAAVTVMVLMPEILPEAAVMVAKPVATAVARPLLLTVATEVTDELQVTCVVISRLIPSEYVPVAVNWLVTSAGRLAMAGVTDMEVSTAGVTVRVALPEMVPEVAVMVAEPVTMGAAKPLLLTVATEVFDDLQVTCMVIS
jgi:hypothetical protein